jgi:hypothetical protein
MGRQHYRVYTDAEIRGLTEEQVEQLREAVRKAIRGSAEIRGTLRKKTEKVYRKFKGKPDTPRQDRSRSKR